MLRFAGKVNAARLLILGCALGVGTGAEEVFPIPVWYADPLFSAKLNQRLVVTAIDNGDQDEVVIVMPNGGIYEFRAELRIGPRIIPLNVHDLLFSGIRLKVGDAFTKDEKSSMSLAVTNAFLK